MTTDVSDRRTVMLAVVATGALGTALALSLVPGDASAWVSAATPFIAFGGLWALTALLLSRTTSPRWMLAFPQSWVRAVGALAVISLVGAAVPIWSMVFSAATWAVAGCVALAIAVRDALAATIAVGCVIGSVALIPSWPLAQWQPTTAPTVINALAGVMFVGLAFALAMRSRIRRNRFARP